MFDEPFDPGFYGDVRQMSKPMVHRDPETGEFVSADASRFDDVEVVSFAATVGIPAADLDGSTAFTGGVTEGFEGLQIVDYDEVVDRNEELVLITADHSLSVMINSTETADGSVRGGVAISASPARLNVTDRTVLQTDNDLPGSTFDGSSRVDDTIDLVGRPLLAAATGPFSDGSSGAGGGGAAANDRITVEMPPAEFGRFHPRDELFLNGAVEVDNIDDAGIHLSVAGQHVYGVTHG